MRVSGVVAAAVGLAAGAVGAVASYHGTASPGPRPDAAPRAEVASGKPLPSRPARVVVRVERCHRPATLVGGTCVTRVVRTVVVHDLPAPATPAQPTPTTAPATARPAATSRPAKQGDDRAEPGKERHPDDALAPPEPGDHG